VAEAAERLAGRPVDPALQIEQARMIGVRFEGGWETVGRNAWRLDRLGHKIGWWPDWTWLAGAVCTVVTDEKSGVLKGGADPRRPSYALGL
jgi:gamma-glutamyltranspeptidase